MGARSRKSLIIWAIKTITISNLMKENYIMKKEIENKSEIKLIGVSVRTNNKNEINPETSKIAMLSSNFFSKNVATQIVNRKNPGITFAVYTEYDSNEHGDYTYFIGEEVNSFENIPNNLDQLVISAAQYQKFTTPSGKMPEIVINAWQQIWKMSSYDFGGERTYQADFEIYDDRAQDLENTILDIYIGIK